MQRKKAWWVVDLARRRGWEPAILLAPPNACLPRGPTGLACTRPGLQVLILVATDVWRTRDPRLIAWLASLPGTPKFLYILVYIHIRIFGLSTDPAGFSHAERGRL